jgi:hypothetical protein
MSSFPTMTKRVAAMIPKLNVKANLILVSVLTALCTTLYPVDAEKLSDGSASNGWIITQNESGAKFVLYVSPAGLKNENFYVSRYAQAPGWIVYSFLHGSRGKNPTGEYCGESFQVFSRHWRKGDEKWTRVWAREGPVKITGITTTPYYLEYDPRANRQQLQPKAVIGMEMFVADLKTLGLPSELTPLTSYVSGLPGDVPGGMLMQVLQVHNDGSRSTLMTTTECKRANLPASAFTPPPEYRRYAYRRDYPPIRRLFCP